MVRSTLKKVMWVGRATVFTVGLAVILAVVFGVASLAWAHTADTQLFHLGHSNTASEITKLTANIANPALQLANTSTSAGATALRLQTEATKPPMRVNSSAKVANLNADQLDGKDSTELGQVWAVVRQNSTTDCTLLRGSGATGTTGNAAENFCTVEFSRDLTNCAFIAGLSEPGGYPGADGTGEIWAFLGSSTSIAVRTADSAGGKAAKNFHVAAFC
jgi:hypothetical protein